MAHNRTKRTSGLGKFERIESVVPNSESFRTSKGCTIIVALEPALRAPQGVWLPPSALMLWHLSIGHRNRYPTWDEIADARYEFVPDSVTMAMLLPPPDQYVNLNEHVFHLWEIDDKRAA